MRKITKLQLLASVVLALAVGSVFYGSRHLIASGQNDFAPLYVAAQLAGTDQLYEEASYREFLIEQFGGTSEALVFIRPPFYAALLWPLGLLPYEAAHIAWILLRLAAVIGFIALWRVPSRGSVLAATIICLPIIGAFVNGQDGPFLLLFLALTWRWFENDKPLLAGLALSLCAVKFHLFLLLPLWLLGAAGRPLLKGFSLGAAILTAVSFVVAGPSWPAQYAAQLQASSISPIETQMPNLHGLLMGLPGAVYFEALAALAVAWACWRAVRDSHRLYGFAVVLLGGMLVSYHAYFTDCVILLPAVLVLRTLDVRRWLKPLTLLLLLPAPLLAPRPAPYLVQLALIAVFFAVALAPRIDAVACKQWK